MSIRQAKHLLELTTMLFLVSPLQSKEPQGEPAAPKLITLTVIASDNRGEPVTDLKANDFRVSDAGRPQTIRVFRRRVSEPQSPPRLEPGEYSSRTSARAQTATVIVFDLLNESFAARSSALTSLIHSLQSLKSANNLYLYLMTLDGRLVPVRGIPNAVRDASAMGGGVAWTRDIKAIEQTISKNFGLSHSEINIDTRVRMTYRLLADVARQLTAVPGSKNIVWVTRGVPIVVGAQTTSDVSDSVDYTPLLHRLSATLDRIGISVYPVQQTTPGMAMDGSLGGKGSEYTLEQLALLTGGTTRFSGNVGAAVRQAMNDARSNYVLGYEPPADSWDGRFHKLRVTSLRHGVHLQFKAGYVALDDAVSDEREKLLDVLRSPFDATEIGVRGKLTPQAGGTAIWLECHIQSADLRISRSGVRFAGRLAVLGEGVKASGETQRTVIIPLDLNLTAEASAKALASGIEFDRVIAVDAAWTRLRIAVLDHDTQALGSVTIPLSPER
jgi:VWFA-related protein